MNTRNWIYNEDLKHWFAASLLKMVAVLYAAIDVYNMILQNLVRDMKLKFKGIKLKADFQKQIKSAVKDIQ